MFGKSRFSLAQPKVEYVRHKVKSSSFALAAALLSRAAVPALRSFASPHGTVMDRLRPLIVASMHGSRALNLGGPNIYSAMLNPSTLQREDLGALFAAKASLHLKIQNIRIQDLKMHAAGEFQV